MPPHNLHKLFIALRSKQYEICQFLVNVVLVKFKIYDNYFYVHYTCISFQSKNYWKRN